MPCTRPPRRRPRARARNTQRNPIADAALLESRFFAPPTPSASPAAREPVTSAGRCTHGPAAPLEDAARAELYSMTSGEEHAALRVAHERIMDEEPGYCAFFVEWVDRRRRLLDAKPVLIQGKRTARAFDFPAHKLTAHTRIHSLSHLHARAREKETRNRAMSA